jgi:hypothetical protein
MAWNIEDSQRIYEPGLHQAVTSLGKLFIPSFCKLIVVLSVSKIVFLLTLKVIYDLVNPFFVGIIVANKLAEIREAPPLEESLCIDIVIEESGYHVIEFAVSAFITRVDETFELTEDMIKSFSGDNGDPVCQ